jgi:hypothetical protein
VVGAIEVMIVVLGETEVCDSTDVTGGTMIDEVDVSKTDEGEMME